MRLLDHLLVVAILIVMGTLCFYKAVNAQEPKREIQPYAFADVEENVRVYKVVHEGCELYIVVNNNGHDSVGITTGRGCK